MNGEDEYAEAALEMLNSMLAEGERERFERAVMFVVRTIDPDNGKEYLDGPFSDVLDALRWAEAHEADLNHGAPEDELPWKCAVLPVEAVDE